MCINWSCDEGSCERCRKIDRMCDWPYGYEPPKKKVENTPEQEKNWNIFFQAKIKETEEMGRKFYKGK